MNRREFSQQLCGAALSAAIAKMALAQQQTQDPSGKQHSTPEKPAEIAMLIYPGMMALDQIGPQQVFRYLPGVKVEWTLTIIVATFHTDLLDFRKDFSNSLDVILATVWIVPPRPE